MVNEIDGGVQTPDEFTESLEEMIDTAAEELASDQEVAEVKEPARASTYRPPFGSGAMVRLLPSMKDKALTPGQYNAGMETFTVPSVEDQKAGFWMDNATKFIPQYRQFGFMTEKGGETPAVEI